MNGGTVLFNSITWAIRAQKLLNGQGIGSNIRKISKVGQSKGCAYGLDVKKDFSKALRILENSNIRIVDVIEA